jgi:hypothetical protein
MFVSRPVLTLALDGDEKSLMHFQAAISVGSCGGGVKPSFYAKTMYSLYAGPMITDNEMS